MKKLMSILLATVMCVTCGGIDCSAARAKAFSRRTHSSSSRGSSSRSRGSSWFGPRKRSIWSSSSSSGSSCGSRASSKSDVIVVNNNNNNVAQTKSDDKEKEVISKEAQAKAVVIKGKEDKGDGHALSAILIFIVWPLLAIAAYGVGAFAGYNDGYDKGLGVYTQDNADYENCLHSWENLKCDVFEYWTPEKYKNMTESLQKEIFNKFKVFDKECMTEE